MKYYQDIPDVPDFSVAPARGFIDERSAAGMSNALEFIEWPWKEPQRTFGYAYVIRAPELEAFRQLLEDLGGRHLAGYVPTWEKDLTPIADIAANDLSFNIVKSTAGYAADFLVDDREDTPGRVLYLWDAAQTVAHIVRIVRVFDAGGGNETVELEKPVPFAVTRESGFVGWAYVCRPSSDDNAFDHLTPGDLRTQLSFKQQRHHVDREESLRELVTIESVPVNFEPWIDITATIESQPKQTL